LVYVKKMSKQISVNFKKLKEIFDLLKKHHECAGTLIVKQGKVQSYTISKGESDSVRTPLSIWNWHTHPLFLYSREGVCWGWPSGEDLREVVLFGLGGNKAHFVFTLEGVYIIKITSCFKNWLAKTVKDPWDRGLIVAALEMVFKSTHNLRTNSYNKKYKINPTDWINMVHRLRITFLFDRTHKGNDPCGKITCKKIITHDNDFGERKLMTIDKYAETYEGDKLNIYKISKTGTLLDVKKIKMEELFQKLERLGKDLEAKCPNAKLYNINFVLNSGLPSNFLTMKYAKRREFYRTIEEVKPHQETVKITYF